MSILRSMKGLTLNGKTTITTSSSTRSTTTTTPPGSVALLINKSEETGMCSFLLPTTDRLLFARGVSSDTLRPGELYHLNWGAAGEANFSALKEEERRFYVARGDVSVSIEDYATYVLSSHLLALRARYYFASCATVTSVSPLTLMGPLRTGFLKQLRFRGETGLEVVVDVEGVERDSDKKTMEIFGTTSSATLKKGDRLHFVSQAERTPYDIQALARFYEQYRKGVRSIGNPQLMLATYGDEGFASHVRVSSELIRLPMKDERIIILNAPQSQAVHHYQILKVADCLAFAVESPPGTGKTLTLVAMAVIYCGAGLQLLISTSNVAVFNIAHTLAEMDFGDKKIVHLMSVDREAGEEQSPFSIMNLEAYALNKHVIRFRELRELLKTADKAEQRELMDEMRKEHTAAIRSIDLSNCDIIIATADTAFGWLLKKKHPKKPSCPIQTQLETRVTRIAYDEASQLTEAGLTALREWFPNAMIALIGDSKQLPPFKYVAGDLVSEMGARSALEVIKRKKNLPVIKLRETYRHTARLMPYNPLFYGGKLVSGKKDSRRILLAPIFNVRKDCMFMIIEDAETTQSGTSKTNEKEIAALEYVVGKLKKAGYDQDSIMIIAYYEAQRKLAAKVLPGYEVLTVDSAQGREKDIVIVLTTRDEPTTADFFTSVQRCNVSTSRHKEALIVIGCDSLLKTEPWLQLLQQEEYFSTVCFE